MGINKITKDMVGLKFHIVSTRRTPADGGGEESNEFDIKIRFEELSDEGIEIFGLTEEDFDE